MDQRGQKYIHEDTYWGRGGQKYIHEDTYWGRGGQQENKLENMRAYPSVCLWKLHLKPAS
eukprot:3570397-Heterocapsa_arctica.AAC.1